MDDDALGLCRGAAPKLQAGKQQGGAGGGGLVKGDAFEEGNLGCNVRLMENIRNIQENWGKKGERLCDRADKLSNTF